MGIILKLYRNVFKEDLEPSKAALVRLRRQHSVLVRRSDTQLSCPFLWVSSRDLCLQGILHLPDHPDVCWGFVGGAAGAHRAALCDGERRLPDQDLWYVCWIDLPVSSSRRLFFVSGKTVKLH